MERGKRRREREKKRRGVEVARPISSRYVSIIPIRSSLQFNCFNGLLKKKKKKNKVSSYYLR